MRRFVAAACATGLGVALSSAFAMSASASAARTIVVRPGHSIQAAVNRARPGDTVLVKPGVYHQTVQIRKNGITLRGSGAGRGGTVLRPPASVPKTLCNQAFGPTGVCVLARKVDTKTGAVLSAVHNDTVRGLRIVGFPSSGVFGYGTDGLRVTRTVAINNGAYGISRFESTRTLFAHDVAIGSQEAGFYVGDSPHAGTVVRDNVAIGNQLGIFIRHARHVLAFGNRISRNCQGILVLDDGQPGGVGNAALVHNRVVRNNKLCPKNDEMPFNVKGGGILLLGATRTLVAHNRVAGNRGQEFNSGGIVVLSSHALTGGSDPEFDAIVGNRAFRNRPADLIWDGSGTHIRFRHNHCGTSAPAGLCH